MRKCWAFVGSEILAVSHLTINWSIVCVSVDIKQQANNESYTEILNISQKFKAYYVDNCDALKSFKNIQTS